MPPDPYHHADAIRVELARRGMPHGRYLGDTRLQALGLLIAGKGGTSLDAVDALCMFPRPVWVVDLCGEFPLALEMTHPEDVASTDDFGHSGTAPT